MKSYLPAAQSRNLIAMAPEYRGSEQLNLIFDADDTLWESNPHFLEAQAAFLDLLASAGHLDRSLILAAIRTQELAIIDEIGYGRRPYLMALHRVAEEIGAGQLAREPIDAIGAALLERHCPLLPGVAATLEELSTRHRLLLFSKGQPVEQMRKLDRSGLRYLFSRIGFPLEKDAIAYLRLLAQAELDPACTVMIGNSPRSDINPAIRAGLRGAIYIPYPYTWELEHEDLIEDPRVMTLPTFPALLRLF